MTTIVKPSAANLLLHREVSETLSETEAHLKVPSHLPTPLIGRWADESFPLNSRQASEIVQEQAVQRQRSSIVFEDANGNEFSYGEAPALPPSADEDASSAEYDNSELAEKLSVAQGSNDDMSLGSPTHVSRCYRFDPYNLSSGGVDIMYCCYCEGCNALINASNNCGTLHMGAPLTTPYIASSSNAAALQLMEPVAPIYDEPISHHLPPPAGRNTAAAPRGLGASPDNSSMSSNSYGADWDAPYPQRRAQPPRSAFATHLTQTSTRPAAAPHQVAPPQPAQGPLLSSFMPPPPPPRIMTLVLEEEGNRRASSIYYHVLTRWYNHAVEAQEFFVPEEEYCPAPNKDLYSFDEWADRVSGWWYTHFENMQKKQTRFAQPPSQSKRV